MAAKVTVTDVINKYNLRSLTPQINTDEIRITRSDINRPALPLAGYFLHFDSSRVQGIGNVEYFYTKQMEEEKRLEIYKELLSYELPCVIFSRELVPDEDFLSLPCQDDIWT